MRPFRKYWLVAAAPLVLIIMVIHGSEFTMFSAQPSPEEDTLTDDSVLLPGRPHRKEAGPSRSIAEGEAWTIGRLADVNQTQRELFSGNANNTIAQMTSYRYEKTFTFPDGESIVIAYNNEENYQKDAEERDVTDLYSKIQICKGLPRSREEFEQAVELLGRGREQLPPELSSIEDLISASRSQFEECLAVDVEAEERVVDSMRQYAEAGHHTSMSIIAHLFRRTDPTLSERYYRRMWENGSVEAGLGGLAGLYEGRVGSYEGQVRAFAYFYARRSIRLAELDGLAADFFVEYRAEIIEEVRAREATASASILDDAIAMAKEIIRTNENCCKP